MSPMTHAPDPTADGLSTNDYCASLPRRRYTHQAQGLILKLPRTGLVVVPFRSHKGGWSCVVVEGYGAYPVGGYDVSISNTEIETATELHLGEPVPVEIVTAEEADALEDGRYILTRTHGSLHKATVDGQIRWVRNAFGKVSVSTEEIADQFPLVVTPAKESAHA
ncbi:hypothetical protein IDT60_21150 (plasmid) [Pseudarthrobacter sp. BIM B-2242]|nr:hypothetical protein IDT60_21150 [Pseudarthrobacter sp. BIM B-2242]